MLGLIRAGTAGFPPGDGVQLGEIVELDPGGRTVDVKKRKASRDLHPWAAFAHDNVRPGPLPESLERLARWVAERGVDARI